MPQKFPPASSERHTMRNSNHNSSRGADRHRPFSGAEAERDQTSSLQKARQHAIAVSAEFVGTTMFLWFAFAGAQTAAVTGGAGAASTPATVTLTSLSFGFSLLVNVWAFYRISGGLFNPAVCAIL